MTSTHSTSFVKHHYIFCIYTCTNHFYSEPALIILCFLLQVVELLNQAALMGTEEKLTVLKQVCY